MSARKGHAYVFQQGRFDGDEQFWREKLSPTCKLDPLRNGRTLRFILTTDADFDAFWRAYREEASKKRFYRPEGVEDPDSVDADEVGED
jgi:hypothetical protein